VLAIEGTSVTFRGCSQELTMLISFNASQYTWEEARKEIRLQCNRTLGHLHLYLKSSWTADDEDTKEAIQEQTLNARDTKHKPWYKPKEAGEAAYHGHNSSSDTIIIPADNSSVHQNQHM